DITTCSFTGGIRASWDSVSAILVSMGPFTLLEPLGQGGMGEIWLAHPRQAGDAGGGASAIPGAPDLCVVKLVKSSLLDDADALTRFLDESRVALLLRHPFIARVVDAGRAGDVRYLAL